MILAQRGLSTEFRLLAQSCIWPQSDKSVAQIRALAGQGIDWAQLIALAKRHRVEGLVHHALVASATAVPGFASNILSAQAKAIAAEGLMQAAAGIRIGQWLKDAGIRHLFVKGSTLSVLAYGDLSLKQARDIDLLVAPEQAREAATVLRQEGFGRAYPTQPMTDEEFDRWMAHCKESLWTKGTTTLIELHTGLVDNPDLLRGVGTESARQEVQVAPGKSLATLGRDELFAYLCVHGATHGWSRLKWLADLCAYVGRQPAGRARGHVPPGPATRRRPQRRTGASARS